MALNKIKYNVRLNIELDRISEDPRNFYETEGGDEIEKKNAELMESIKADGLIHAITLRPDPEEEEKYIIISGHRRFKCYQRLAAEDETFSKIPCVIKNIKDDLKARLMLLEANTTSRETTAWEKAEAVKTYHEILDEMKESGAEMPGRRRDRIAAALGMSKSEVGRFENINRNLSEENKEELKRGNISTAVADKLASMPEEKQKEIHDATGGKTKLSDLAEKPMFTPPEPEPKTKPEFKWEVHETPLNVPKEKGWITVRVVETINGFLAGANFVIFGESIGVDSITPDESIVYKTYEEAFDAALMKIRGKSKQAAEILDRMDERQQQQEDWQDQDAGDAFKRRRFALETVRGILSKEHTHKKKMAEFSRKEGDTEGSANLAAVVEYLEELMEQIDDDLKGFGAE